MEFYCKRALYVLACFIILIYNRVSWAESECDACHAGAKALKMGLEDVYAGIYSYRFRHNNVDRECRRCHVIEEFQIRPESELYFPGNTKEGIFFLTGLSLDKEYELELKLKRTGEGTLYRKVLKFKPSSIVVEKGDDAPPAVKTIRFLGIRKGVIPEGLLYFETDRPVVSVVEFWKDEHYRERVSNLKVFLKEHVVRLSGLKDARGYRYRIITMDVFGNRSVSEGVLFGRKRMIENPRTEVVQKSEGLKEPSVRLFRPSRSADLCLHIRAPEPVMVSVKMREIVEHTEHGYGLQSARYTNIYVCTECHSAGISHPVGVRSTRADVEIPREMPTIEGGVITCTTCHYPHGGNRPYFARFDFDRICNMCHKRLE